MNGLEVDDKKIPHDENHGGKENSWGIEKSRKMKNVFSNGQTKLSDAKKSVFHKGMVIL